MLEDDIYIPAYNDETEELEKIEKVAEKEIEFEGLGEKYEKIFYEEITYGETREREGRIDEKLQYAGGDDGWDGRVRGRHWRGRSSSRCRDRSRRSNYAEVWQVGFDDNGPYVDNGDGDTWRGQLRDNWSGRVSSIERELSPSVDRYWRGRSPGISDVTVSYPTWV